MPKAIYDDPKLEAYEHWYASHTRFCDTVADAIRAKRRALRVTATVFGHKFKSEYFCIACVQPTVQQAERWIVITTHVGRCAYCKEQL